MTTAVEFRDVSVVFGDDPDAAMPLMDEDKTRAQVQAETGQVLGVHACNLVVDEGEIQVLVGPAGSGKSTLLRAVNGANALAKGMVLVRLEDGMANISDLNSRRLRRLRRHRVTMVFQEFGLLPWRSVRDNVSLGLEFTGLGNRKRQARIDEHLEMFAIAEWSEHNAGDMPDAVKQRVGMARAFSTGAPIILMDEPFARLEVRERIRLQDDLLAINDKQKRTIVMATRDLDEGLKIGDHIAIMDGGRIVQSGRPSDVLASPAGTYVSAFVSQMNPLGVLTAREVMEESIQTPDVSVDAGTPIHKVIELITGPASPLGVTEFGNRIGVITRASILRQLIQRNPTPSLPPRTLATPGRTDSAQTDRDETVFAAATEVAAAAAVAASTERKIPAYEAEADEDPVMAANYYRKDRFPDEQPEKEPAEEEPVFEEPVTFDMNDRLIDYADGLPEGNGDDSDAATPAEDASGETEMAALDDDPAEAGESLSAPAMEAGTDVTTETPVPDPEPVAGILDPEPVAEVSEPEPALDDAEPEPVAEDTEPEPVAEEPASAPVGEERASEPIAEDAASEPSPEGAEPELVAESFEPEPEVEAPEPEQVAEAVEPEPASEDTEPAPLAEDLDAEPDMFLSLEEDDLLKEADADDDDQPKQG